MASVGESYGGLLGTTYPSGPSGNPQLASAIQSLLTPGLVPDIARQSAEISAGRGIAGSPAADSTAVRMSEQNWLQRLGLANTLMSGQTNRDLPYQITPYQKAGLDLQMLLHGKTGGQTFAGGGGGGGGGRPTGYNGSIGSPASPWASPYPVIDAVSGTRPNDFGSGGGIVQGGYLGGQNPGGGIPETLDDVYDWLGFGNFGSLPGDDSGGGGGIPDFDFDF